MVSAWLSPECGRLGTPHASGKPAASPSSRTKCDHTDLAIAHSETQVPVLPAMLGVDHELAALELCERKGLPEPRHEGYVTATATAGPEDIGLRLRAPVLPPRRISGQAVGGGDAVQRSRGGIGGWTPSHTWPHPHPQPRRGQTHPSASDAFGSWSSTSSRLTGHTLGREPGSGTFSSGTEVLLEVPGTPGHTSQGGQMANSALLFPRSPVALRLSRTRPPRTEPTMAIPSR